MSSGVRLAQNWTFHPGVIIHRYLNALAEADLEQMRNLFAPDAIVNSPLYGTLPASEFFPKLFGHTSKSGLKLKDVFQSVTRPAEWIGYFTYEWTLTDGEVGSFDVCDVFRFDLERGQIVELTIIYDTARAPARARARASA